MSHRYRSHSGTRVLRLHRWPTQQVAHPEVYLTVLVHTGVAFRLTDVRRGISSATPP